MPTTNSLPTQETPQDKPRQPNQFHPDNFWTAERLDLLRLRWAANRSQQEIANEFGITRNAVAGKISRLGLKHGSAPQKPRAPRVRPPSPQRTNPVRRLAPAVALPPAEPSDGTGIALIDLTNTTCRWPKGDAVILFCGDPSADLLDNRPYCPFHANMARRA